MFLSKKKFLGFRMLSEWVKKFQNISIDLVVNFSVMYGVFFLMVFHLIPDYSNNLEFWLVGKTDCEYVAVMFRTKDGLFRNYQHPIIIDVNQGKINHTTRIPMTVSTLRLTSCGQEKLSFESLGLRMDDSTYDISKQDTLSWTCSNCKERDWEISGENHEKRVEWATVEFDKLIDKISMHKDLKDLFYLLGLLGFFPLLWKLFELLPSAYLESSLYSVGFFLWVYESIPRWKAVAPLSQIRNDGIVSSVHFFGQSFTVDWYIFGLFLCAIILPAIVVKLRQKICAKKFERFQ